VKLTVATPLALVVEADDVMHLRAEDESGAFGILPGHADFLTALSVSVVSWRDRAAREHHVAVRSGMLEVRGGDTIAVATIEAIPGDDLGILQSEVLTQFRRQAEDERVARIDAQRLYLAAIRRIYQVLRPTPAGPVPGVGTREIEGLE
jgi:F-type H+-transporting ATPase subunit epsilon